MAIIIKDLGVVTAYAYAVLGGYTGTEEEFTELLGNIAIDLSQIENLQVVVNGLPAGESPTASYSNGVLTLGIPKGDKGDGIAHVNITTLAAGSQATASYDATTETLSLGIPKGDKGDPGATGNGVQSIAKTGTSGNVDTYTITYTNGNTTTFTVTNGAVTSVSGKTGAVVLDAGDVAFDDSQTYANGTVGKEVSGLLDSAEDHETRIDILEALEKGRGLTPAQIQQIAASGKADEYFQPGDVIYVKWTDKSPTTPVEYDVPVVVAHIGDVYDQNDVVHHNALWLMWKYTTPQAVAFDAPEAIVETGPVFEEGYYYYTKNADDSFTEQTVTYGAAIPAGTTYYKHVRSGMAGRLRYGSNDWSQSAFRQWLNSSGGKGDWWTPQHASDVAPAQATSLPGFLTGFEQDWLDIIKPVKVQTSLNTVCDGGVTVITYDKFFLPSLEQMYGSPQAAGIEGVYWEYWKDVTGLSSPSNGSSTNTNAARQIPTVAAPTGAAVYVRLRSSLRSTAYYTWFVSSPGYLGYGSANSAFRAQPACVIY